MFSYVLKAFFYKIVYLLPIFKCSIFISYFRRIYSMKKIFIGLSAGALALSLAACGDKGTSSSSEPAKEEQTEKASSVSVEDVFNKTTERQGELKSTKADIDTTQKMSVETEGEKLEMNSSSKMTMEMIVDPMAMHLKGEVKGTDPASGEEQTTPTEMYLDKEKGVFVADATGAWMKMPAELTDTMLNQNQSADAKQQLEQLKPFMKDFKVTEKGDEFILTLNAEGEKFNTLIQNQASAALPAELQSEDVLKGTTIEKADYVIYVDKKTYDIKQLELAMVMTMDIEGQKMNMDMDSNITYSDVNKVEEIVIPQEVLDNATEAAF